MQVLWHLPERFCADFLTNKMSVWEAQKKTDVVFSKWLQGLLNPSLNLYKVAPNTISRVLRCLPNCQQITHLRGPGKVRPVLYFT